MSQSGKFQNKIHMNIEAIAIMIPIVSIVGLIVMIIYLRKYENEERMAMIDKGIDPAIFTKKARNTSSALRASLLLIGAGLGLLLGYALDRSFDMEEVGYFSMLFILGGVGLGLAYMIEENKIRKGL
jgi:O-antigen/teichoic acid export membrane protein